MIDLLTVPDNRLKEDVTPRRAGEMLVQYSCPLQRRVNKNRVSEYDGRYRRGEWLVINTLKFARFRGKLYLIDGQHRLHAVVKSGVTVSFTFEVIDVGSWEELRAYYAVIDGDLSRSENDYIRQTDWQREEGFSEEQAVKLKSAIKPLLNGFQHGGHSGYYPFDDKLVSERFVRLLAPELRFYLESTKGCDTKLRHAGFNRAPIMAAAMVALRFQREPAMKFFAEVVTSDPTSEDAPSKRFARWLDKFTAAKVGGNDIQACTVAGAFNLFLSGKKRVQNGKWTAAVGHVESGDTCVKIEGHSFHIDGTPYKADTPIVGVEALAAVWSRK